MTMNKGADSRKKRYARYNQRFKVLINRDDFQADVTALRKKWKINPENLVISANEQKWWDDLYDLTDEWEDNEWPKYAQELKALEKAALDKTNKNVTYKDLEVRRQEINALQPFAAFHSATRDIHAKYKLPPGWKDAIRDYVLHNQTDYRGSVGIKIVLPVPGKAYDVEKDYISIEIDAYTTKKDLMDEWPNIKFHLNNLKHKRSNKFQPIDDAVFERNRTAYRLRSDGNSLNEIAEILSDRDGKAYTFNDVSTMIKNYKAVSGIN